MKRLLILGCGFVAAGVVLGAPALRAEHPGDTSGPASGTAVQPPTAVEKENPHISKQHSDISGPSGTSAGAPGIEGKKGTQGGKAWTPPAEIRGKAGSS